MFSIDFPYFKFLILSVLLSQTILFDSFHLKIIASNSNLS